MNFEPIKDQSDDQFDESFGIREVLEKYLAHQKWFWISALLFLVLAFFKLRYESPKYKVDATILIKERDKGNSFADLSAFEDLGLFGNSENSLENEIEILKSRRLMRKVVEELKLNVEYYIEKSPIDKEFYPNFPVVFNLKKDTIEEAELRTSFEIVVISDDKFEFIDYLGNSNGVKNFGTEFKVDLGTENYPDHRTIIINKNDSFEDKITGEIIKVYVNPFNSVTAGFMNSLVVEPVDERSKIVQLSINETNIAKGIAIINNLIEQYNADGVYDKMQIASATTKFLDDRLVLIANEIEAIETSAAQFKTNKGMIDAASGADIYLQSSSVTEGEMIAINTQLQLINYMLGELNGSNLGDPLPGNIGLADPVFENSIITYNELVLQRNRVIKSSSEINPIIVAIDAQLRELRNNLIARLNASKSSTQIQIKALSQKSGNINSRIASVPKYEKEYKDIVRDQETKNALYLFLLQKREESILSNAVKVEKAKIIDTAYSNGSKVSPKNGLIYFASLILGLLIPFLVIYIKDQLDTKIHDEKDIRKLRIPYLGDVPFMPLQNKLYLKDGDNTNIAEAFRYIRTNINFMLDSKTVGKTVFVTSTQSGEGKTFTAINLANSLAISGKKTLLLGMDLRAPKVNKYLNIGKQDCGVTHFIKDNSLSLIDILNKSEEFESLDIINSGAIPPNPVELLMSVRIKELFREIKEIYEYIIVDTAPVGMVTDTIQIANFADLTIYVVKANHLDKRMLHIPEKLSKEGKLPNMSILINGTDHSKGAYGYGYGYHYGTKKKKSWHERIFKSAAM